MTSDIIETGMGRFSKDKFDALTRVREKALDGLREALKKKGYREVTTSSLVNIAGSCENPHKSFTLNYYGREAHLSQSAQIQLESLVLRLKQRFFTVNNSFREENYDDPEASGRRLSEFTLIEPERPYEHLTPDQALVQMLVEQEDVVKDGIYRVINECPAQIDQLGGNTTYLFSAAKSGFPRIKYADALELLNRNGGSYRFGDDLGIREERSILRHFEDTPTFVTHYPAAIKFFNMKRSEDGETVLSADLLTPKLGETSGGAIREENGEKIKQYLRESKLGIYLAEGGRDPEIPFAEYFRLFEQELPLLRGGYGIGFERFVAFLLGSNDILDTIAYRTLTPAS